MSERTDNGRALIAAFERARDIHENRDISQIFSMALMGVFFLALMAGLAAGASLYRFTTEAQLAANNQHLESGLLTNIVRANDLTNAVDEGEGPEGRTLILRRTLGERTYETRIYLYEGHVVQELAAADRPLDPRNATELLETSSFDFELQDGLLTITCDDNSFDVALRCDSTDAAATSTTTGGGA